MRFSLLVLLVAGAWLTASGSPVRAEPPPYLLLRLPARPLPHQPTHQRYPGTERSVSTHAYAYGWFGVAPRQHWSRHFGYYRNYTQWSGK